MIRAALLARVSTDDQAQAGSIQTQIEFARRWAPLHGYELAEIYADEGWSGTIPVEERPQGARLLRDAREGRFAVVLVYQVDRLGRDPLVVLHAVQELAAAGVRVQSMQEAFDERDPMGRFLLTLFSGIGRLVRDQTIARSIEGSRRKANAGAWLGGVPPYGYRIVTQGRDNYLMPDEEPLPGCGISEAEVVRRCYRWYLDGWSSLEIARHLHALGLRLRSGYAEEPPLHRRTKQPVRGYWTAAQVVTLLARTVYRGEHVYGKRGRQEPIRRPVPPLVDEATWYAARERAQANHTNARRNTRHAYLLRGLLRCACGRRYQGNTQQRYSYYLCASYNISAMRRHYEPDSRPCAGRVLRQAETEERVWAAVWDVIRHPERLREIHAAYVRTLPLEPQESTADREAVERSLAACDERERRIRDAVEEGFYGVAEARDRLLSVQRDRAGLRDQLRALAPVRMPDAAALPHYEDLAVRAQADLAEGDTPEKRRRYLEAFLREIGVRTEGREVHLTYYWRFVL